MAIALVQQAVGTNAAALTAIATLGASPTAGNALVACFTSNENAITTLTGGGVTWSLLKKDFTGSFACELWYGLNSSGSGTTITATIAGAVNGINCLNVSEWSGIKTSGAADASTDGDVANSTAPSTGPITASAGPVLYIANLSTASAINAGPGNSFTALTNATVSSRSAQGCYRIDTSPASATPSWTTNSGNWSMVVGALQGTRLKNPMGMAGMYGV